MTIKRKIKPKHAKNIDFPAYAVDTLAYTERMLAQKQEDDEYEKDKKQMETLTKMYDQHWAKKKMVPKVEMDHLQSIINKEVRRIKGG